MASVYILYSSKLDKFYIGSCFLLEQRIFDHQTKKYSDSFTAKANDWVLYFSIRDLNYVQARKIEVHIKKMKSRTYFENLIKYPEISEKLRIRFR
jgi:putative endonuclease